MDDKYLILRRFDPEPDDDATAAVNYDEMLRLTAADIAERFAGTYRTGGYMTDTDVAKLAETHDWPDGVYVLVDLAQFKPITLASKRTVSIADDEIPF